MKDSEWGIEKLALSLSKGSEWGIVNGEWGIVNGEWGMRREINN